jgi:nicotinate-nucleotide adenylyltransferase
MKNVGIFGGTFDPPHLAHLIAGERAVEAFALEKLLFIPASIPPHKSDVRISAAEHRLAMVEIATKGNDRFAVSRIELDRPAPSYTIDTLYEIQQQYSPGKIFLFIGLDQFATFNTWRETEKIFEMAEVVVMARPTHTFDEIDLELMKRVKVLSIPLLDISSTDIRERVREGKSIRYVVPDGVREYIAKQRLYRD